MSAAPQPSAAGYAPAANGQGAAASRMPPPWEAAAPQAAEEGYEDVLTDDEPPSWVTESYDDSAAAPGNAPAQPAPRAKPSAPTEPYVITPVPELDWDGNWPALAATLPLRGVSQQLAFQTQLIDCKADGNAATIRLKCPIDTLRASGNTEKLQAALNERFAGKRINVEIEIGPVWYTASAEAQAYREKRQRDAEETVASDPFVQMLEREFNAFIVPGSVHPPAEAK